MTGPASAIHDKQAADLAAAATGRTLFIPEGDYCSYEGEVFKANWASGPGSSFAHRHLGTIEIGPVPPDPDSATTQNEGGATP